MSVMTMSHVFVEGCIVPMAGGLSGPMSVYVPKAALTVVQEVATTSVASLTNAHGVAADREDLTLEERKAQRERLQKWVEAEDRKIAAMEQVQQVRTERAVQERVEQEQVRVEMEQQADESETEDADDDLHMDETLEQMIARKAEEARKEKANKLSNARRERAAVRFDGLVLGTRLRNRQELNDGTTDYLECKKAAGRRMCEFNGQMMSLNKFVVMHRTGLKTDGKTNRDVKGDALLTMENFRERKNKFAPLSSN